MEYINLNIFFDFIPFLISPKGKWLYLTPSPVGEGREGGFEKQRTKC
jgi:hypothetical protein